MAQRCPRRVGYWTGGGGAFLTDAARVRARRHVSDNAHNSSPPRSRARAAFAPVRFPAASARLQPPAEALGARGGAPRATAAGRAHAPVRRRCSRARLRRASASTSAADASPSSGTWTGLPASRGELATDITARSCSPDRPPIDRWSTTVKRALAGVPIVDAAGAIDLPTLAALLAMLDLLVTGDTGPMHLAAAMGTPLVALFGPADPRRYGPRGSEHRVLRVDLPCSPCGQVAPAARCAVAATCPIAWTASTSRASCTPRSELLGASRTAAL